MQDFYALEEVNSASWRSETLIGPLGKKYKSALEKVKLVVNAVRKNAIENNVSGLNAAIKMDEDRSENMTKWVKFHRPLVRVWLEAQSSHSFTVWMDQQVAVAAASEGDMGG